MTRPLNKQQYCGWCGSKVIYQSRWISQCPNCHYKRYFNPTPCSNIIIANEDKVLMVKRAIDPEKNKFDLPGGFLDMSDGNMEAGMLRELNEELGITKSNLASINYFGSIRGPDYIMQNTAHQTINFYYVLKLKNKNTNIQLGRAENSEIIWITRKTLDNVDFAWHIDKQMLVKYFDGVA